MNANDKKKTFLLERNVFMNANVDHILLSSIQFHKELIEKRTRIQFHNYFSESERQNANTLIDNKEKNFLFRKKDFHECE